MDRTNAIDVSLLKQRKTLAAQPDALRGGTAPPTSKKPPPTPSLPTGRWAVGLTFGGNTNWETLLQEITDHRGPQGRSEQVAIELSSVAGERTWNSAFERFEEVIWIGPAEGAEAAIRRVLEDRRIDEALFRNEIRFLLSSRGTFDYSSQRVESNSLLHRIQSPPPPQSAPYVDQLIHSATALANRTEPTMSPAPEVTSQDQPAMIEPDKSKSTRALSDSVERAAWPPDNGWHIRPGEFAFNGQRFPLSGVHWKILRVFIDADRAITREQLIFSVWGQDPPELSSVSSTLAGFRKGLRKALKLSEKFNPLPSQDRGDLLSWKFDKAGIQAENTLSLSRKRKSK